MQECVWLGSPGYRTWAASPDLPLRRNLSSLAWGGLTQELGPRVAGEVPCEFFWPVATSTEFRQLFYCLWVGTSPGLDLWSKACAL